jgi:hypothetical protein
MHRSFVPKVDFTRKHYDDSEPRVERRFAVQYDALQPEVSICRFWENGGSESGGTHQLVNLLTASALAFDSFQR